MSFGTQIDFEKVGLFVAIMSEGERSDVWGKGEGDSRVEKFE